MKPLGLYIHIPFCKKKCNYCDFYSKSCGSTTEYVDALCEHLKKEAPLYKDYEITTIFIGGGTPSLLDEKEINKLCKTIKNSLKMAPCVEFSIEANPGTLTKEKLQAYIENGINRISIGLQSANEDELRLLGRIHTTDDFEKSIALAKEVGFDNINVDVMYALPGQTVESLAKTIDYVSKFNPDHISAYCLKIEEGTPFYKQRDTFDLPSEDTEYQMYMYLCKTLDEKGYLQYEISNFSKPQKQCAHNLTYWLSNEYVGFGPSAHSFINGKRYFYENDVEKYKNDALRVDFCPVKLFEEENEIKQGSMDEYVMLRLRLSRGIDLCSFKAEFGVDFEEAYPNILDYYKDGYALKENGTVHFTSKGFFVSNYILSRIL